MFIQDLYLLAFDSSEIRTPLLHLKNEVFRKGFDDWKPVFVMKCKNPDCGKEFQEVVEKCDKCGSTELRPPDEDQIKHFDKIRSSCNIFNQSFEEICKTCLDDVNIVDDLYIYLNKQYQFVNKKLWQQVVEIRRIHPALVEFDLDKNGVPKNSHWFCPIHRDDIQAKAGECGHSVNGGRCGLKLMPAMYIWNHRGQRIYLPEDEVIHTSKFSVSETYGYSVLLTIMQKVLTISGMDRFLYRYFFERKAPTGIILTYTDDPQSLETERARIESRMMEDPTYMPWVAVSSRTNRGRTDFVRLFHTLQEMDYLPVRNEIRDRIAAIYGVPQMYMNVMEGLGGISGETQQLKVFSNVIQSDQRLFNEKIFPAILKAFGITDWKIELRPPEEKVEGMILQLAQQRVMMATQMLGMGFEVKLKPGAKDFDTLDFTFSGEAKSQMDMMGGMGGMDQFGGMPLPPQEGGEGTQELPVRSKESVPERAPRNENKIYDEDLDEDEDEDSYENQVYQ